MKHAWKEGKKKRVEASGAERVCSNSQSAYRIAHRYQPNMTKDQEKKDESGTKAASDGTEAKGAEAAPAPATEAIEEDDAFEEFEPSAWGAHDEEAEDVQQWQVRGSS